MWFSLGSKLTHFLTAQRHWKYKKKMEPPIDTDNTVDGCSLSHHLQGFICLSQVVIAGFLIHQHSFCNNLFNFRENFVDKLINLEPWESGWYFKSFSGWLVTRCTTRMHETRVKNCEIQWYTTYLAGSADWTVINIRKIRLPENLLFFNVKWQILRSLLPKSWKFLWFEIIICKRIAQIVRCPSIPTLKSGQITIP